MMRKAAFILSLFILLLLQVASPLASVSSSKKESAGVWSRLRERWRGGTSNSLLSEFDPGKELEDPPSWIDDDELQGAEETLDLPKDPPAISEDYLRVAYGTLARKRQGSGESNNVKVDEETWREWDERFGCDKFRLRHGGVCLDMVTESYWNMLKPFH